jgi:hypothetical protein
MSAGPVLEVDRPLATKSGRAAAWFGEPGGAIQHETDQIATQMLAEPVIEVLPDPGPGPADLTSHTSGGLDEIA